MEIGRKGQLVVFPRDKTTKEDDTVPSEGPQVHIVTSTHSRQEGRGPTRWAPLYGTVELAKHIRPPSMVVPSVAARYTTVGAN
jgi:hypothetical protein